MLPTLEAVLVAFHKHPSALVHLLDDDVETAYAVFGFASNFCISSLERADELDLAPDRRARLLDTLRALITPSGGVDGGARAAADWAARAEAALRDAPRPDLPAPDASVDAQLSPDKPAPARAELSVYVQLMRASAEKAASDRRARAAAAAEAAEEETRAFDEPLALARTAGGDGQESSA